MSTRRASTAVVTGITGQDGFFLAASLLADGYAVTGLTRDPDGFQAQRLARLLPEVSLVKGDVACRPDLEALLASAEPDEIYHLASTSLTDASWQDPEVSTAVSGFAMVTLLEATRATVGFDKVRLFNASSAEVFGATDQHPQTERTPLRPRSPYGCAKAFGQELVRCYRDRYAAHLSSGILYNHESELRPQRFVTRKITSAVARIAHGSTERLTLGDLEARRDWGFAGDFATGMRLIVGHSQPGDYVLATGQLHSVRDVLDCAFHHIGIDDWASYVDQDAELVRPTDSAPLVGDATRARSELGWHPALGFEELVIRMLEHDLAEVGATTSVT